MKWLKFRDHPLINLERTIVIKKHFDKATDSYNIYFSHSNIEYGSDHTTWWKFNGNERLRNVVYYKVIRAIRDKKDKEFVRL
jgi:hypothetical protein